MLHRSKANPEYLGQNLESVLYPLGQHCITNFNLAHCAGGWVGEQQMVEEKTYSDVIQFPIKN